MEPPAISDQVFYYLSDIRRWTKFLAIIGFITIALMVLFSLIFLMLPEGFRDSGIPFYDARIVSAIYLVNALIFFFPALYLYKFSKNLRNSLRSGDESSLIRAFRFLRAHYRFLGIITIILLALGALSMVMGFFAAIFSVFMVG
jgi:hypothetical protein